jgi:hypothetical protein
LGFRDGNMASERIAAKNNYKYYYRTSIADATGLIRPITYYKYAGKKSINESYTVIPQNKTLTSRHWVEQSGKIISRVNPKMLSFDEYIYLTNSVNKPISLTETYFAFSSPHYGLKDKLKKEKIKISTLAVTDKASKKMFDPTIKGDIVLNEFFKLVEDNLDILEINKEKTSMILGNTSGEVRANLVDGILMIEDFILNK